MVHLKHDGLSEGKVESVRKLVQLGVRAHAHEGGGAAVEGEAHVTLLGGDGVAGAVHHGGACGRGKLQMCECVSL